MSAPIDILDDDDALAEALADAWIEQAAENPVLRRAALEAVGLLPQTKPTLEDLAEKYGVKPDTLTRTGNDALLKLRHHPMALIALRALLNPNPH
jgi:DNA-directed RNA polymerase sigma subunit (sigma70/sigma32)